MELHFVPSLDQVVTMKSDYSPYSCSELNNAVNGILTPTTPSIKSITADNPFYVPPPFQPFSYSQSPTGCYQVSPIEFSPSNKPTSYGNNYYARNDEGNYYNSCGYSTVVDTPDSGFENGRDVNQFDCDDNYFKFDSATVGKFMEEPDILVLDTDYVNYNEENCNSKNQSPCSSPMDPWINMSNTLVCPQNVGSNSPRIENTQQFVQSQMLPSINQAFSTHFTTNIDCANIPTETINNPANNSYDQHLLDLDSFESTLFEILANNENSDSNEANAMQPDNNYINPENYNFVETDVKPNREYKNIWSDETNTPTNAVEKIQNYQSVPASPVKQNTIQKCLQEQDESEQQLVCFWKDCNQEYYSQATLVSHIEKSHVSSSKGDEYTCLWTECPRQYRSFNARYKLLIHMRVHSGEKPNKCPVSVVNHNLHLCMFQDFLLLASEKPFIYGVTSSFRITHKKIIS